MKDPVQVSDRLFTGDQPTEEDLERLAKSGFRSIINLRKAGEPKQPLSPEEEQVYAEANGLNYVSVPVASAELTPEHLTRIAATIGELPSPIFIHCAVGQRSAALAVLSELSGPGVTGEELIDEAAAKGVPIVDKHLIAFIRLMAGRPHVGQGAAFTRGEAANHAPSRVA